MLYSANGSDTFTDSCVHTAKKSRPAQSPNGLRSNQQTSRLTEPESRNRWRAALPAALHAASRMSITSRIADLAEIRPGYLTRKPVKPRADGTHHLLQIRDFNLERSAAVPGMLIRFTPDAASSLQVLRSGDVVFLARGARNFACALADLPGPTVAASYFFVIHPGPQVLPGYLAWCLNQPATLRAIARSATSGAHMPVVRRADIESVEIPLPPLSVQNTIVELDSLMREEQSLLRELARKQHELISAVCMTAALSDRGTGAHP